MHSFGQVPRVGETLLLGKLKLEITELSRRRVRRVLVTAAQPRAQNQLGEPQTDQQAPHATDASAVPSGLNEAGHEGIEETVSKKVFQSRQDSEE